MSVAIFDDEGDYGAVIVSGANLAIAAEQVGDELFRDAKVLVLQNEIPEAVNEAAASQARRHGVMTILNAAPARPFATALPELVDILVVNAIEAEMLGRRPRGHAGERRAAATALARPVQGRRGHGRGATVWHTATGPVIGSPARHSGVVTSTHGAGDAFVGTLAARLATGRRWSGP